MWQPDVSGPLVQSQSPTCLSFVMSSSVAGALAVATLTTVAIESARSGSRSTVAVLLQLHLEALAACKDLQQEEVLPGVLGMCFTLLAVSVQG